MKRLLTALLALAVTGCVDTTGGGLVTFHAAAAGPANAPGNGTWTFENADGFAVTLTQAVLHVGSVYLNAEAQASISMAESCVQEGVYVGEVLSSLDVDLLNPSPQPFPAMGTGLAQTALEGEVWLNGPVDVTQVDDPTVVFSAMGTATRAATATEPAGMYPFSASITIGANRVPPVDPAYPGKSEICIERIVAGIPVDFTPQNDGTLILRIDPTALFATVDFSQLEVVSTNPPLYQFFNNSVSSPDNALFDNGIVADGSYSFSFLSSSTK